MNNNKVYQNKFDRERSKREDLSCCDILKRLEQIFAPNSLIKDAKNQGDQLIQELKMRCSEHCGNTVRDK